MERSDMMARVHDVRAGGLLVGSGDAVAPADRVIDFLIHDEAFPRSIARCVYEIGSALDALPRRDEATQAHDELVGILAQRSETSNAVMLHDRIREITDALDRLHEVVAESDFVSRTHQIAAV